MGREEPYIPFGALVDCIGSGRFGKVYKTTRGDGALPEFIAVKQVRVMGDAEDWEEKKPDFLRVFEKIRNMRHDNIVTHIQMQFPDAGPLGPLYYYALMELCEGGSLHGAVKGRPLPLDILQRLTHQLTSGLAFLHEKLIVHRDLKGDNVLLTSNDLKTCDVKIADFGEMKQLATGGTKDTPGPGSYCKGTFSYMSPEIINGADVDNMPGRKTDIWSLGCVVIEMASGAVPQFSARTEQGVVLISEGWAIMNYVGHGGQPNIPTNLSPLLERFIAQCLAQEPADRPSARDLLHVHSPQNDCCTLLTIAQLSPN